MRGNPFYSSQYDGTAPLVSSPEVFRGSQWTHPVVREISFDDYEGARRRGQVLGQFTSTATIEGTSTNRGGLSSSSNSDVSDFETSFKSCLSSSHCNFSSRRSFLSKPVHPVSFPFHSPGEASTSQRDAYSWRSSGSNSSTDFTDICETLEAENLGRSSSTSSNGFKCGLCERFLSHRSPYSSRRIVRSGDMPVSGILSCRHVFHAECLEHITPKLHKSDPPCPICSRFEEGDSPDHRIFARSRNSFQKFRRPLLEEGAPPQNAMLVLHRHRLRRTLSLKANSIKAFPGKLRNGGLQQSSQLLGSHSADVGAVAATGSLQV